MPAAGACGQMAAPVLLSASLTGAGLKMQWPLSGAGMALTTATSLSPASVWIQLTNAVQNTGTVFYTSEPLASGTNRFYRLQNK